VTKVALDLLEVKEHQVSKLDDFGCCGFHQMCTEQLKCVRTGEHAAKYASRCSLFKAKWHQKTADHIEFVELHVHGTFSQKDGFGLPEQLVNRAKEIGLKAIALTDHGATTGHPQLEKAAKKAGIKPIYGCEFYMVPNKAKNQQKKHHITVLAKNPLGYENLLKLSSLAYTENKETPSQGNFYYMPTIDLRDLITHKEGLVVLDGCTYGLISSHILNDNMDEARRVAAWFKKQLGDNFYLEVQPLVYEPTHRVAEGKAVIGAELGIPLVATNDVHYLKKGQEFIQNFLRMVRINGDINNNQGMMDARCYLTTGKEMAEWFKANESSFDFMTAIANTVVIADSIEEFDLPKGTPVQYPVPAEYRDAKDMLVKLSRKGWVKRGLNKLSKEEQQVYADRFKYELSIIEQKQFIDYFLVVADAVEWAKSTKPLPLSDDESKEPIMVGPARGSAAGSLVSYLMLITEVDPIKHELMFERFIDISRPDPPDIDLDFQHDRRDEVKEYFKQKHGYERVANIAGYTTWGAPSLLDDIGRCFKIPKKKIEEVKNQLVENGGTKTVRDILQDNWPELVDLHEVEGMIRGMTIHAAGVIVASDDLSKYGTIGRDGIMLDKRDAEYMNLLKVDALSLKTLTILGHALKAIGKDAEWLYALPLDDKKTMRGFNQHKFQGVFQFEGGATKGVCKKLKVEDFHIAMDITSLSRPGPLQSGATKMYIDNSADEVCEEITRETRKTRGQVLYQEQMMRILRGAGLDWPDVTAVRKLVTKKEGYEKLEGIKARFLTHFEDQNVGEEAWQATVGGAGYGFNISHACSYTHLTYYCMYLKVHYPLQFYWANMLIEPNKDEMLREFQQCGGKILGVKFGKSKASWSMDNGCLRAGYLTIDGIGPKSAEKLERGEMPTGSAKAKLEAAGGFTDDEDEDYLGLAALQEKLDKVQGRNKISEIQPGEWVRVAGVITQFETKNLKEFYRKSGKDYSEVEDPEKCLYVNMKIADESGDIMVGINRYLYSDPLIVDLLATRQEGDIFIIIGEKTRDYEKIRATRIQKLDDIINENDEIFS
jgi:DNA polymerase-3 subunit alpha